MNLFLWFPVDPRFDRCDPLKDFFASLFDLRLYTAAVNDP